MSGAGGGNEFPATDDRRNPEMIVLNLGGGQPHLGLRLTAMEGHVQKTSQHVVFGQFFGGYSNAQWTKSREFVGNFRILWGRPIFMRILKIL